jgi:ribosomal protein S18 acetylase RimI-like enzyme
MSKSQNNISFCYCDFKNIVHCEKLIELLNQYMIDPMGDSPPLNFEQGQCLIQGLSTHPSCFVLFVKVNNEFAGLGTCLINFSTFKAKSYINLHDIIILQKFRGRGVGKKLLEKIIEIAKERNCCKITLEVREDNLPAKKLYADLGFRDTEPMMHFWAKTLA